jgi:hypothetical protein
MKDIKSQPASTLVNDDFSIPTTQLGKIVQMNNRYEPANESLLPSVEATTPIIRRYSFDDNGGGYEGL